MPTGSLARLPAVGAKGTRGRKFAGRRYFASCSREVGLLYQIERGRACFGEGTWFKKGSGTFVRSTLRAVPAKVPDPFCLVQKGVRHLCAKHPSGRSGKVA